MTSKPTISVALAIYNEALIINKCLDAVSDWVDEIVIVDGQSTDNTLEILKKYKNVKVISTTNKPMFHLNKQMAIDACQSDWILQLDADEIVSLDLKNEIIKVINSNPKDNGFWIKRKNYFLGKFLTKGGVYPDPTIRLYRQGKGKLPCLDVHEQAIVDGTVSTLNNDLLHYADPTFSRYLLRNDRYTSLLATDFKKQNISINFFSFINHFIFKPTYWFFLAYFRHRGYVDGFPGFVFAWYSALRFPIAYIKLYELNRHEI
ncbi:MAG TPA: glycosyltransferase family 2 protein [Candidatus Woesebacteria bacterium]|nr:glycosyltransferase family 2 protein [Candidatus Woesebacteria bacterium]